MIIKDRPLPPAVLNFLFRILCWFLRKRFNKMPIAGVPVKPDHSYLLMCNHFSFWDGFLAVFLYRGLLAKAVGEENLKGIKIMVLKKQMEMNWWLKYFGCFSVEPGRASIGESLSYAAEILNTPGNVLLMYPQGNLESSHVRHIMFKEGIGEIVPKIVGNCQLLWSSNIPEYFESLKPSVYFNVLDCGTNYEFDFEKLQDRVNKHHQESLKRTVRFTRNL